MPDELIVIKNRRSEMEGGNHLMCPSHERIDSSVKRQEEILEDIREDNKNHQLMLAGFLSEVKQELKSIQEIKLTLVTHDRRWTDSKDKCAVMQQELRAYFGAEIEKEKKELLESLLLMKKDSEGAWAAIGAVKTRQDKKDGTLLIITSLATSIGVAIGYLIPILQDYFKGPK